MQSFIHIGITERCFPLNFLTAILVVSKAFLFLYERYRKFPIIVCPGCCTFWNFSMFGSIIGCAQRRNYKPWSNMKILMLFHYFDVIPWFNGPRRKHPILISVTNNIYHGPYSWTYLNQLIRIRWFK